MYKALITEKFHNILIEKFILHNIECDVFENITTEEVLEIIQNYDILIVNSKILVDEKLLLRAKKLRVIGRVGSGMEIIDTNYCKKNNIYVCSAPKGNAPSVAEHCLAMLLCYQNNILKAHNSLLTNVWQREQNRGELLYGKNIGIIGYGNTGKCFAKLLQPFGVNIFVYDILNVVPEFENIQIVDLEYLQKNSDIISFHIPLNDFNFHFVNSSFLDKCKLNLVLINSSRGKIIDQKILFNYLESNKFKAALLDVFEDEPLVVDIQMKNLAIENKLIFTPHIAGWTYQSFFDLADIVSQQVISYICDIKKILYN